MFKMGATEGSKLRHKPYTDVAQSWLVGEIGLRFESKD